jgi:hypothetical protein
LKFGVEGHPVDGGFAVERGEANEMSKSGDEVDRHHGIDLLNFFTAASHLGILLIVGVMYSWQLVDRRYDKLLDADSDPSDGVFGTVDLSTMISSHPVRT